MNLDFYFEPVPSDIISLKNNDRMCFGNILTAYSQESLFPSLENIQIAIIGVPEDRKAVKNTSGSTNGPDEIRKKLYPLFPHWNSLNIVDLGNVKRGNTVEDTYFAVKDIIRNLLQNNTLPVIIGGSQDLTYPNYLAYENTGKVVNIAAVDSVFDLGHEEGELNARSYLSHIILHQPNFLFNYTNIGYQSYFVNQDAFLLMKNLFFDINRLGNVHAEIEQTEPMVRNADILTFDISAVRAADAPGSFYAGANGLTGAEACQICRYAGMNDKLTSAGFYEYNPDYDPRGFTAQLIAQMIWYFLDGFANRKNDLPKEENTKGFIRFRVVMEDNNEEIVFLKSKKTDRWWMEIPVKNETNKKLSRVLFIPCSYEDYQTAMKDEIPDRWWQIQQKIM